MIEHVPDLIGWLLEVAELLRPGGVLDLFVPDVIQFSMQATVLLFGCLAAWVALLEWDRQW